MPYRAIILMLCTVALALLAVGLWVREIAPLVAATPSAQALTTGTRSAVDPGQQLRTLVKGTLVLTFMLILILMAVGIFSTWRAWIHRPPAERKKERTTYVDAWKLAGERLEEKKSPEMDDH